MVRLRVGQQAVPTAHMGRWARKCVRKRAFCMGRKNAAMVPWALSFGRYSGARWRRPRHCGWCSTLAALITHIRKQPIPANHRPHGGIWWRCTLYGGCNGAARASWVCCITPSCRLLHASTGITWAEFCRRTAWKQSTSKHDCRRRSSRCTSMGNAGLDGARCAIVCGVRGSGE